jgi:TRAP-type C4-dicarboxylate transport system permease small subunit
MLEKLSKLSAILAGVMLTFITLMTCASLAGRNLLGTTLVGDFELTAVATGAAVALFMPLCQYRRGNIIVDFFTAKTSETTTARLDRMGAALVGVAMGVLAWRTTLGALSAYNNQGGSMILGFPDWIVYATMVPPLALTMVIGFAQAMTSTAPTEQEGGSL